MKIEKGKVHTLYKYCIYREKDTSRGYFNNGLTAGCAGCSGLTAGCAGCSGLTAESASGSHTAGSAGCCYGNGKPLIHCRCGNCSVYCIPLTVTVTSKPLVPLGSLSISDLQR